MSVHMSVANNNLSRRVVGTCAAIRIYISSRPRQRGAGYGSKLIDQLLRIGDLQESLAVSRSTTYRFLRRHNIPIIYVLGAPRIRATDVAKALSRSEGATK